MSIEMRDVRFAYEGRPVLTEVNLLVRSCESVGIVGVSGGGKSTLLKLVSGLYEVQGGVVLVAGARGSAERRRKVAMVMQSAALFPASIRDNITCGHAMDEALIRRACEAAQLGDWIDSLPAGLDTFVGERGGKVSGGQAQRIAIARAMAKDAQVVLLDEPTSALDDATGAAVIAALNRLTENRTVLHVSHRRETLSGCDRILHLEGGRLHAP